jgi:glycerol-3-phosphate acyltransferase PlsX
MGGDFGPDVVVPAAIRAIDQIPGLSLILCGDEAQIGAILAAKRRTEDARLTVRHASQKIEADELPSQAMRGKRDSSMRVALDLVKAGEAVACVSAGNTGALMAIARYVLKTLPGIDRPAIASALPAVKGHTHMLDLGANADPSATQIFQFAVMGSVLASAIDNLDSPRVGLLNIGAEEIKGNERIKEASRLITESDLNYLGFVEGDDIYTGDVDVVVCDGFAGNVALKSSEGVARMIGHFLSAEFKRSILTKMVAVLAMPVLKSVQKHIDPRYYNGASLVGLRSIVVKSHGSADELSFLNAIKVAVEEVNNNVPERISDQLSSQLGSTVDAQEAV